MKTLIKIQSELKAHKSKRNTFGNYNYRSCEDILEAVKPLLKETESILTITDDIQLVGDRVYVKATATLKTKDSAFTSSAFAREPLEKKGMDASQITGMASSYARKYALNGLFAIDDTQDADSMDNTEKPKAETKLVNQPHTAEPKPEPTKLSQDQITDLEAKVQMAGGDLNKTLAYFKVKSTADLTVEQYSKVIAQLEKKK